MANALLVFPETDFYWTPIKFYFGASIQKKKCSGFTIAFRIGFKVELDRLHKSLEAIWRDKNWVKSKESFYWLLPWANKKQCQLNKHINKTRAPPVVQINLLERFIQCLSFYFGNFRSFLFSFISHLTCDKKCLWRFEHLV